MSIDIEKGLISKLLECKDILPVKDRQIKYYYFSKQYRDAFKYIDKFYVKNGTTPTVRLFEQKFPNFKLDTYIKDGQETIGTEEPIHYWCDKLREKATHNKLCDGIEKVIEHIEAGETDKALALVKSTVIHIENNLVETNAIDITQDAEERKQAYLKRKENQGMIGMPTGIDKLDLMLKGIQPKQLVTLIAKTGVGKTWLLILVASYMILQGYRVLFLTTEMSEEQIEDRLEAMLFGMMCGEFNYNKFKSGTLSPDQEEAYFNFLDRKSKLEKCIIETATGVSNVNAKIDQYDPDIVFIDSCYLMDDDQGSDQDWLRVAHITRDLKKLAKQRKIPIFINNQADQTTTNAKTGPELHNMSFSKAIGQDSDVVLALFRDEQMIEDKEMKLKVLKQREGTLGSVVLNWDFSTMNFKSIFSADASGRVMSAPGEEEESTGNAPRNLINLD